MWFFICIAVLVILLWASSFDSPAVDGYRSQLFYMSGGDSVNMFNKLKADGISTESLREFLVMEDRFLAFEKEAVCSGVRRLTDATTLSHKIRDRFMGYDFAYHNIHIRQIANTDMMINKNFTCFG